LEEIDPETGEVQFLFDLDGPHIRELEALLLEQQKREDGACESWKGWCLKIGDPLGASFYEGAQHAHKFHRAQMSHILKVLRGKQT
jgi:hypothetical protein